MDFATAVPPYVAKPLDAPALPGRHARAGTGRRSCVRPSARATLPRRRGTADAVDRPGSGDGRHGAGDLPPRVHRRRPHRPRAGRRPGDVAAGGGPWPTAPCGRTRRSTPSRPVSWPTGCSRWSSTPRRSSSCTTASPRCVTLVAEVSAARAGLALPRPHRAAPAHLGHPRRRPAGTDQRAAGRHPLPPGRRPPPLRRLPPPAAGAPRYGVGRWAGHDRRPGRHSPVPRRHPSHAAPAPRSTRWSSPPAPPGPTSPQHDRHRGARRPRQHPPRPDRRHRLAHRQPARPRPATRPSPGCTTSVLPALPRAVRRIEHHHNVEDALAATSRHVTRCAAAQPRLRPGPRPGRVRRAPAREGDVLPAQAQPRRRSCGR